MKRLLEWKQRMLQSPLTRKSGNSVVSGGSGARSSERSTPTLADRDAPSPRVRIESPVQPQPQTQPSKFSFRHSFYLSVYLLGTSTLFSLCTVDSLLAHLTPALCVTSVRVVGHLTTAKK